MTAADEQTHADLDSSRSVWERDGRALLMGAFRAATSEASVAAGQATAELAPRVHEFRKALRRAGAVLALARPALGSDEYKAIREELRVARRAVGTARDHTVAATALATLPLEAAERESANQLIATLNEQQPNAGEISAQMVDGVQRARTAATAFEAALPEELSWRSVVKGMAGTYRRARRARREAKRSARAFHRWRRRTKELSAQLALLAMHSGPRTQALREEYAELSDRLGPIADLLMLREVIAAHGASWAPERLAALSTAIEGLGEGEMDAARKLGKPQFKRSAKDMARKLARAIRKDAQPVHGDDGDSEEVDEVDDDASKEAGAEGRTDVVDAGGADGAGAESRRDNND
jgi:CHAD domain-containing protein